MLTSSERRRPTPGTQDHGPLPRRDTRRPRRGIHGPRPSVKVIGGGSLESTLARTARGVEVFGHHTHEEVPSLMQRATFLFFPSECPENFRLTLAESLATGLPVVVAGYGAAAAMVGDGRMGRHFVPGVERR